MCSFPTVHVSWLCDDIPEAALAETSPGDSWSLVSLQVTPETLRSTSCRSFNNDMFPLRCLKAGCSMTFSTHIARKAHEKTHSGEGSICVQEVNLLIWTCPHACLHLCAVGYHCPHPQCPVVEYTWTKLQKHTGTHPGRDPFPLSLDNFR